MIDIDSKEFKEYLKDIKKHRHSFYNETVDYAVRIGVHAYGHKPEAILERTRPRESEDIKEYRLNSYEPKTKAKFDEALKVVKKMFNESLYSINWPESVGKYINEDQTLEIYCTENFPKRNSVVNYFKEEGLKYMLGNPNGWFCITPGPEKEETEFKEPSITFYKEDQILDVCSDFLLIHLSGELGKDAELLFIDEMSYYYFYEERSKDNRKVEYVLEEERIHNLGEFPAWPAGGIVEGEVYQSYFDSAVPFWNKAIAHDSDLDGVLVNHAFPQFWAVEIDCNECDGSGETVTNIKGSDTHKSITCQGCRGSGKQISRSPYTHLSVNQETLNDNPAIAPPGGYISPPSDIIELLDKKVDTLMDQGMKALKMHVIIGDDQSGRAKEWDRKELNESIREISDTVFNIHIGNTFYYVNKLRYSVVLQNNNDKLDEQIPTINTPKHFDILTVDDLTNEVKIASEAGISSHYVTTLTKDITSKRFSSNVKEKDTLLCIMDLDPFPNVSFDDKMLMLSDRTVDRADIIISNNIKKFVYRAINEEKDFLNKEPREKYEVMQKYALEMKPPEETVNIHEQPRQDRAEDRSVNQ